MNTEHEVPVTNRALLIHRQGIYLEKHGVYDDLLGKILTKPELTKDEIIELIESEREKVMGLMEKTVAEINSDTKYITKSCTHSCSPADWRKGGKCDKNGCFVNPYDLGSVAEEMRRKRNRKNG